MEPDITHINLKHRGRSGDEWTGALSVDGVNVEIRGVWDEETEEGAYDYYDLYVEGVCINLGEPFYEYPTVEDVREFLAPWVAAAETVIAAAADVPQGKTPNVIFPIFTDGADS